jgi:hypothetical protein
MNEKIKPKSVKDILADPIKFEVDSQDKALLYKQHRADAIKNLKATLDDIFYDDGGMKFFKRNNNGEFTKCSEGMLRRFLKLHGFTPTVKSDDEHSAIDYALDEIVEERVVSWVGELAGYKAGPHTASNGTKLLVTKSAQLPKPTPGKYDLLDTFFRGLLKTEDQIDFFYSWLKLALSQLSVGDLKSGPAIVLAGPKNFGKSLFASFVTKLLGGRVSDASLYVTGRTDFNGDLFKSELWLLDDTVPASEYKSRQQLGKLIKQVVASNVDSCHAKRMDALPIKIWRRLLVCCNDDPDSLKIIPPLDGDDNLSDKMAILKGHKQDLTIAGVTDDEKNEYDRKIEKQIPSFVHFILNQFEIPEYMIDRRWGIRVIQNQELVDAVQDELVETKLHELIQKHITHTSEWTGSASMLLEELSEVVGLTPRLRNIHVYENESYVGTLLGKLAKMKPDIYTKLERTRDGRSYAIKCADDL